MKTAEQWQEELAGETSVEAIRQIQTDAMFKREEKDEIITELMAKCDTLWQALTGAVGTLLFVEEVMPSNHELHTWLVRTLERTPQDVKEHAGKLKALQDAVHKLRAEWQSDCGVDVTFFETLFAALAALEAPGPGHGSTESRPTVKVEKAPDLPCGCSAAYRTLCPHGNSDLA